MNDVIGTVYRTKLCACKRACSKMLKRALQKLKFKYICPRLVV